MLEHKHASSYTTYVRDYMLMSHHNSISRYHCPLFANIFIEEPRDLARSLFHNLALTFKVVMKVRRYWRRTQVSEKHSELVYWGCLIASQVGYTSYISHKLCRNSADSGESYDTFLWPRSFWKNFLCKFSSLELHAIAFRAVVFLSLYHY